MDEDSVAKLPNTTQGPLERIVEYPQVKLQYLSLVDNIYRHEMCGIYKTSS